MEFFGLHPDIIAWVVIAAINLVTVGVTFRTHKLSVRTDENMQKVEIATNNMKDEIVKATAKASFAEGHDVARVEGQERAAAKAAAISGVPPEPAQSAEAILE